jgi:predicted metal-dependent hydrolase
MVKSSLTISIDSQVLEKAREKFKEQLGKIAEEAYRKELNIVENTPDEVQTLQELLELKQDVQRMALQEGGETAIRLMAKEVKKELGKTPETVQEKLGFWKKVRVGAQKMLLRTKLGEKDIPSPLEKEAKK